MKSLRMKGEDSIDDHVAKFKMLVTSSGLGNASAAVTDYYHESLPPGFTETNSLFRETPNETRRLV